MVLCIGLYILLWNLENSFKNYQTVLIMLLTGSPPQKEGTPCFIPAQGRGILSGVNMGVASGIKMRDPQEDRDKAYSFFHITILEFTRFTRLHGEWSLTVGVSNSRSGTEARGA